MFDVITLIGSNKWYSVLASIVDTFGNLRDKRAESEQDKISTCFVCSIDRETFQQKAIGICI